MKDHTPVVITTAYKGVFFGQLPNSADKTQKTLEIKEGQMCIYWSQGVHGVLGLAVAGPTKDCKITDSAPSITLQEVTSVIVTTKKAEIAWMEKPWA